MPHNLLKLPKGNKIELVVSSSIPCGDHLSKKGKELNINVKGKYSAENFEILICTNIKSKLDLFPDKLHRNKRGQGASKHNFKRPILLTPIIFVISQSKKSHNILLNRKENTNLEDNLSSSSCGSSSNTEKENDPKSSLKDIRLKNMNRLLIIQLDVNSLRRIFEQLPSYN